MEAFKHSSKASSGNHILGFLHRQGCTLDTMGTDMSEAVQAVVAAIGGWCRVGTTLDPVHAPHLSTMRSKGMLSCTQRLAPAPGIDEPGPVAAARLARDDVARPVGTDAPAAGEGYDAVVEQLACAAVDRYSLIDSESEHALQFLYSILNYLLFLSPMKVSV